MWSKYITRRLAVQVAQSWNFGWGVAMKKVYGVCLTNTLVFRDQRKTDYYVDEKQHQRYVFGLYKLLGSKKFLKTFHPQAQKKLEDILRATQNKLNGDLSKLSNEKLLAIYQNFILPNVTQFYIRMWAIHGIGEPTADLVRKNLCRYFENGNKVDEYLLIFSSPQVPNDVISERIDLLKLAIDKKRLSRSKFLEKIALHKNKYQHIPMFDFDHEPYLESNFLTELRNIKNPKKEINKIKKIFSGRQKEWQRIIKKLRVDQKFKNLIIFLKEDVFLRDYRDMIRQKLNLSLRKLYQEIGLRLNLKIDEIATLTNEEIIEYLKAGKKFPKSEIQKRRRAYLLIQKGTKARIYSGKKAIVMAKKELASSLAIKVKEIPGVIGAKGMAKGKAKIVFTNKDLFKIHKGDILVAPMTRQDFVPALRKAAAVVTDEGSVTAHAAIIARELKIPCLVATKIATQVLKDGDLVEVDANKGIVKILKK